DALPISDVPRVRTDVARCCRNSRERFGSMVVNDEIVQLIPRTPTDLPVPTGHVRPAWAVGAFYRLKNFWRQLSGQQ
ncbi:MAG: hypothetical protein RBS84_03610, partial [Kiritimatiellia bacterium]|nr:hypothetical protein [Kiritimatiellia bacterium]